MIPNIPIAHSIPSIRIIPNIPIDPIFCMIPFMPMNSMPMNSFDCPPPFVPSFVYPDPASAPVS